jgi:hypothetical protein
LIPILSYKSLALQGPTKTQRLVQVLLFPGDGEWIATAPGVDDLSVTPNEVECGSCTSLKVTKVAMELSGFQIILKGPGPSSEEKTPSAIKSSDASVSPSGYESQAKAVQLFARDDEGDTFSDAVATEFVGNVDVGDGHPSSSPTALYFAIGAPRTNTANGIRRSAYLPEDRL